MPLISHVNYQRFLWVGGIGASWVYKQDTTLQEKLDVCPLIFMFFYPPWSIMNILIFTCDSYENRFLIWLFVSMYVYPNTNLGHEPRFAVSCLDADWWQLLYGLLHAQTLECFLKTESLYPLTTRETEAQSDSCLVVSYSTSQSQSSSRSWCLRPS